MNKTKDFEIEIFEKKLKFLTLFISFGIIDNVFITNYLRKKN